MLNRILKYFNYNQCYVSKNIIYYSIALKKPDGKIYSYYDNELNNNSLLIKDNINEWIHDVYTKKKNKWLYQLLYNDEILDNIIDNIPDNKIFFLNRKGHNKGILLWNNEKIGWLIHSIPKYPNKIKLDKEFKIEDIDEGQLIYGQSFVYIELDIKELNNILMQLKIMESNVYYTNYDKYNKIENPANIINELTLDDNIFHISKSSKWNKDLYDDYIRIFINSKILCQTWMKPGLDSTEHTKNIRNIKWDDNIHYITSQDHSKYAISMDKNKPWIFIGDINRMESQYRRGGGGLLIKDKNLWTAFNKIIVNYNELIVNPNN
jgi:deoxyribonuclease-2